MRNSWACGGVTVQDPVRHGDGKDHHLRAAEARE